MENEQRYELPSGSRSRSQTPLVQNHVLLEPEVNEHHYDLRNKSRERSHTPGEIVQSKRSSPRSLPGSAAKTRLQIMETIIEKKEVGTSVKDASGHRYKNSQDVPVITKKIERRSERQKVRRGIFANGQKQNKEDSSEQNNGKKCKDTSSHGTFTSDYSSEEGEREDEPGKPGSAHEIYKQAGDWWNVFPKTDYTYSEKSQCRYEIAPGVLAMPNMSRRSIHSNPDTSTRLSRMSDSGVIVAANTGEEYEKNAQKSTEFHEPMSELHSFDSDVKTRSQYRKTHVEQYRCHRDVIYTVPGVAINSRSRYIARTDAASSVDSDTELDEALSISSKSNGKRIVMQCFTSFATVIALWFNKLLEFLKLKTVKRREYQASDKHESTWYKVSENINRCSHYIYLFMVKVFLFDSWLLSRASNIRKWMKQRSPKVLWIALLPFLILTGCSCLPYLSPFLLSMKPIMRQTRETSAAGLFASDKRLFSKSEDFGKAAEDMELITNRLYSRINSLEDETMEQSNRLLNISKALEQLKENDFIWAKYNNKMLMLEKKLEEHHLDNAYGREIEAIKLQLKELGELYTELKSCCDTHANPLTDQDFEKRIESRIIKNLMVTGDDKDSKMRREKLLTTHGDILTESRIREIVKEALKVYDADKTGRVDYALESAGGQIISTRCTQKYDIKTRTFKLLAFTLYHENNNPRTVIQGNSIQPGVCWAFQGFPGYLLIKLRSSIYVTGFTVEHAPKSILPNGEMTSAPRKFNVWGFIDENDIAPVMFGDYEFAASDDSLQYFLVQNTTIQIPYEYVELRVHSNHGQLEYTCLYRFRVHGRSV